MGTMGSPAFERAPGALLPRCRGAHRANRERGVDDHPVATLCAVKLALGALSFRPEADELVGYSRLGRDDFLQQLTLLARHVLPYMPDTPHVQTPEPAPPPRQGRVVPARRRPPGLPRGAAGFWATGDRITWVAGLVLALSSFTNWYAGSSLEGPNLAVIAWHTGVLGKLVLFIGLAVLMLGALRRAGIELPASIPESLVVIALGSLATIFVLIRLISIPDTFAFASRGIGIWISLLAALSLIGGGLLRANEEL